MRPGVPERQPHDYTRHGTTTLFAALNVLSGEVLGGCMPRHRRSEFLRFLERMERSTPRRLAIHLILDNYGTHTQAAVEAWFAAHPRYHLHFTPTGASWLNLVERFFAEITDERIWLGTFRSVGELVRAISIRPEMARLTLARKIATIVLIVWKRGASFDAQHLKPQTA